MGQIHFMLGSVRLRSFLFALGVALTPALTAWSADTALPTLNSPRPSMEIEAAALAKQGKFAVLPARNFSMENAESQAGTATTVALWSHTVSSGGTSYKYQMVGRNPFVTLTTPTYNVTASVIPIKVVFTSFSNFTADPEAKDTTCSPKGTATALTKASPLFNAIPGNIWGTSVGEGQYVDLFQRANFNTQTDSTGINPDYHTTLLYKLNPEITVNVSGGDVIAANCGNLGLMDFATWDNYIQTTLMPQLASQSPPIAPPTQLAIFLLYNVVLYENSTSNCCILGYHSAFDDPAYANAFHTYVSVEFDTSKDFTGVADTSAMSHEIAEWMDDPSGNNPTPSWGNVGQVSGCQANLEVGDPLSGTLSQIYMPSNGYTYHVQDLTFVSWFFDQHPSDGVNGWYSFLGNFLGPAVPCT
jgi:hypothetical protein